MKTFLFYDLETSGLNKAFDQVLRFAAIRTDLTFQEVERHEVSIRLRPDVIVSPRAMLTHGLSVTDCRQGITEYEGARRIHRWLNAPGTISVGYNTLGFDDEFLRFTFHRNLLPPYTHQYANGCRRMDILPMAVIYRLYADGVLTWPRINDKPTLKLEHLNAANQLAGGKSHDAMADVEATVALAKCLARKEEIWSYLCGCFDKQIEAQRIAELPHGFDKGPDNHRKALMISHDLGAEADYQAPVLSIGHSIPYSNQTLWLRLDLPALQDTTSNSVADTAWVIRKRVGEPPIILPPHERYWQRMSPERRQIAGENLAWLSARPDLFSDIISYHRQYRYPEIPDLDPDAALYQMGFPTRAESELCRRFQAAPLFEKAAVAHQFQRRELRELALRILWRNHPDAIDRKPDALWETYLNRVNPTVKEEALLDYRGEKRLTPIMALEDIAAINAQDALEPAQRRLITELAADIARRFS